ncbi:hypothetical protein AB0M39_38330 [Streptomyces sp. NPDC051907]|uniref:hypothetical protein n=1 Tax=Streptomyces sp. NPDC051907 TaxID=3155284 RepID=UPI00342E913F
MAERTRTYFGDAVFRIVLQSGDWPGCDLVGDGSLDGLRESLQAALMREGLDFTYKDITDNAAASVLSVSMPVPCGAMDPTADVPGMVVWRSNRVPKPGVVWTLGEKLAGWLSEVPWVTDDFTAMVGLTSLSVRETMGNEPGPLWPKPPA